MRPLSTAAVSFLAQVDDLIVNLTVNSTYDIIMDELGSKFIILSGWSLYDIN